jgi:ACT domain-containing protein
MIMLVDLTDCTMSFDALSHYLQEKGEARGLAVHIQRQDIFDAMHRI